MKNKKTQTIAEARPDIDSNFCRNERVMYYAHVLLSSITNMSYKHGYEILNGLCMPMHLKSTSLDELVKQVNHNHQADNTNNENDDGDYSSDEDKFDDNCLSESNSMKHLLTVCLFNTESIFCNAYLDFILKTKFLVLIALFRKLLLYILRKENKWKKYDQ